MQTAVFYMLESGKPRDEVLGYEIPYIYAYYEMKVAQNKKVEAKRPTPRQPAGRGKRRKTITSDDFVRKARAQED